MKSKLKFFITALLLLALTVSGGVIANAAEAEAPAVTDIEADAAEAEAPAVTDTEADAAEAEAPTVTDTEADAAEAEAPAVTDAEVDAAEVEAPAVTDTEADAAEAANPLSEIFEHIKGYATEIFCGLTFIGSMILAYAYKKGLLPLVRSALVSIGGSVTSIKERAEASEEKTASFSSKVTSELSEAREIILALTERIDAMTSALEEVSRQEEVKERNQRELKIVVETQIDMLYEIFMTSALPQYEKDAVGERVAKMKEALRDDACE